jgi:hypothetical protein
MTCSCDMRKHFVLCIAASRPDVPAPVDLIDFVRDIEAKPLIIVIKFCPFCGEDVPPNETREDPRGIKRCERCGRVECEGFCSDD